MHRPFSVAFVDIESESSNFFRQWRRLDAFSILNYVIKKGRHRGVRHCKVEAQRVLFVAHNVRRMLQKRNLKNSRSLPTRFKHIVICSSKLDCGEVYRDGEGSTGRSILFRLGWGVRNIGKLGLSHWSGQAEMHRWNSDQISEKRWQMCSVSTVNLHGIRRYFSSRTSWWQWNKYFENFMSTTRTAEFCFVIARDKVALLSFCVVRASHLTSYSECCPIWVRFSFWRVTLDIDQSDQNIFVVAEREKPRKPRRKHLEEQKRQVEAETRGGSLQWESAGRSRVICTEEAAVDRESTKRAFAMMATREQVQEAFPQDQARVNSTKSGKDVLGCLRRKEQEKKGR